MIKTRFSLLLPDYAMLFASELNHALLPDPLRQTLKKARFRSDSSGYYRHLINLFSEQPSTDIDLPIARLRGGSNPALCADPGYLHPDRDKLLLFYRDLDLTLEEARRIAQRIQPLLDEFNARLQVHSPNEWLLELEATPEVTFTPREGLNSLPVTDFLPRGRDAQSWIRLWNEIQMLLFECPENQAREAAGKVPVNCLWFWGKGDAPSWRRWPHVSGKNPVLRNLAAESNSGYYANVTKFVELNARQALHVLAFDSDADWELQLTDLTDNWLLPAVGALKKWQLGEIEVIVPEWGIYRLTPFSSWRFWS